MARVKVVRTASDLPDGTDTTAKNALQQLLELVIPGEENPEFTGANVGWSILAAQSPHFALKVAELIRFCAREMSWSQRSDLRELAVQTVNYHFKCDVSFQSHLKHASAAGVGPELIAAIPYWHTTGLFNEEQRLVVEYTLAVVVGTVPDELFARAVNQFGEKKTIEMTAVIGQWSFWAMMLNATVPKSNSTG